MNEPRFTPDEVARLLALSADHAERRRAMADPEFAALALTLAEFESPTGPPLEAGDAASARAELARRVLAGSPAGAAVRDARAVPGGHGRGALGRSPTFSRFLGWLGTPTGRGALAFASVAIVAGLAWWSLARTPRTETVRGVVEPGSFALAAPRAEPGRVTIAWSAEPLAEAYRVVFIGADLAEVTHVEVTAATEYAMRRDSLPTGLVSGTHLSVEVVALRGGAPIATTEARPIRVP